MTKITPQMQKIAIMHANDMARHAHPRMHNYIWRAEYKKKLKALKAQALRMHVAKINAFATY